MHPGYSFPHDGLHDQKKSKVSNPGPDHYNIPQFKPKLAKSLIFRNDNRDLDNKVPGPGTHNPDDRQPVHTLKIMKKVGRSRVAS